MSLRCLLVLLTVFGAVRTFTWNDWTFNNDDALDEIDEEQDLACHYKCASQAWFDQGTCGCSKNYEGNPNFLCYKPTDHACWLSNDPGLSTFGGEHVIIEPLGSSNIAEFSTDKRPGTEDVCQFKISAWTERVRGKIYYKGMDMIWTQVLKNGERYTMEIQIDTAVDHDGVILWHVRSRSPLQQSFGREHVITSDLPSRLTGLVLNVSGCDVVVKRARSYFLQVSCACCGVKFGIRPFYPMLRVITPGIWVTIDRNHNPLFSWTPNNQPLCLDIDWIRITDVAASTGLTDPRQAMTYLALTNGGLTYYKGAPEGLVELRQILMACPVDRKIAFFQKAGFMIREALFIHCISHTEGQNDLINLLINVTKYFCLQDTKACFSSLSEIMSSCHHMFDRIPDLHAYVNTPCG